MGVTTSFANASLSKNPIWAEMACASTPGTGEIFFQSSLECTINGVAKTTGWLDYTDVDGNAIIRADEYLAGMVSSAYDFPSTTAATPYLCPSSIATYDVTVSEFLDGDLVGTPEVFSDKQVMRGGLSFQKYPSTNYFGTTYTTKKFLTWYPGDKVTNLTAKEFLYFIYIFVGSTSYKVTVTITYTDGTTGAYDQFTPSVTGTSGVYAVYGVPVSYSALDIAGHLGGKVAWYYDVKIRNAAGTDISESRRYYVDYTEYPHQRTFLFLNSLNGIDTLICNGYSKERSILTSQTLNQYVPHNYAVVDGQFRRTNIKEQGAVKTSSSFRSQAEVNYFREILLSKHIVEVVGSQFLPVEILPGSFMVKEDDKFLPSLEFEYKYLFTNEVYTP